MKIKVNDKFVELADGANISRLFQAVGIRDQKGIAVAVNDEVLPRSAWASTKLQNNDHILLITAAQGG